MSTNHENHIKMWDWLAKTGKDKHEWPEWDYNRGTIDDIPDSSECFACAESKGGMCQSCPIDWRPCGVCGECQRGDICFCLCESSLFVRWDLSKEDLETRKALAAEIRDLPWEERKESIIEI